jgi:Gpi18-like mannosyltransferase
LAGVIISALGTLGAMLALYDLTKDELSEAGGLRTAFYLVVFPSGFFLAQVYTEGLFVGLCFGCMALVRRRQWMGASLLAVFATWTRAGGAALIIPLAIAWLRDATGLVFRPIPWKALGKGLLVLSPMAAYLIWSVFLGTKFHVVESIFFGRETFALAKSLGAWGTAFSSLFGHNPQSVVYYKSFPIVTGEHGIWNACSELTRHTEHNAAKRV